MFLEEILNYGENDLLFANYIPKTGQLVYEPARKLVVNHKKGEVECGCEQEVYVCFAASRGLASHVSRLVSDL